MAKFTIYWTENCHYRMDVDAESREEALDNFLDGIYDMGNGKNYEVELEDSVEVMEASNG